MRTFRDCAVAALAALLTVALLELGLRAAGVKFEPSLYEAHPRLHAVWRPNAEGWTMEEGENYVRINNFGMRDRDRSIAAVPGTVRIAFLGDSMIVGQQVPLDRTMTQVLEHRLSQSIANARRQVEVLNFGVGGYALSQMYLSLDEHVWAFHPDIVAVCVSQLAVPNSYRKTASMDDQPFFTLEGGRLVPDPGNVVPAGTSAQAREWHRVFGDLHNRVRILQLLRVAQQANWQKAFVWSRTATPAAEAPRRAGYMSTWPYRAPATPELAKAWEITEAILDRMIVAAREHNAEFWLIQIGNDIEEDPRDSEREEFLRVNELTDFRYASERYAEFAARHRIFYIDLAPPMREYAQRTGEPLRGFFNSRPYKGHWNEAGNAVAARIIETELLSKSHVLAHERVGEQER
jgi:hypothetical protein